MIRCAKLVVAAAVLLAVASPALAQPWSATSNKCHPRSMYGQYNYAPSVYGYSPGYYSARSGLGYGYSTYRAQTYAFPVFQLPAPTYGLNYGAVYADPRAFGFGPYNW